MKEIPKRITQENAKRMGQGSCRRVAKKVSYVVFGWLWPQDSSKEREKTAKLISIRIVEAVPKRFFI